MRSADLFEDPAVTAALGKPGRGRGRKRASRGRTAEDEFAFQVRARQLPEAAREWRFAKSIGRQWRFDFAFLSPYMIAVEVEGLVVRKINGQVMTMGRHASITGLREDMRKYNTAALLGWTVLRFEQKMISSGEAIETTMRLLAARGWRPTSNLSTQEDVSC